MAGGLTRQAYCGCISQATSYCETDALLLLFCGCDPAYMPPAMPLVSLNADPGALDAFPGYEVPVLPPLMSWQLWSGWPSA